MSKMSSLRLGDRQGKRTVAGAEFMVFRNIHTVSEPAKPMEPRRHGEPELANGQ